MTPQEGWIWDDTVIIDGLDCAILRPNDGLDGGSDFASIHGNQPVTIYTASREITYPYTNTFVSYWRGSSDVNWWVDGDWYLYVFNNAQTTDLVCFDYSELPNIKWGYTEEYLSASSADTVQGGKAPIMYFNDSVIAKSIASGATKAFKLDSITFSQSQTFANLGGKYYFGAININNFCVGTLSTSARQDRKLDIALACPVSKLPPDMEEGDAWPVVHDSAQAAAEEYQKVWSQALTNVFPQSGSSQVGMAASVNKELANEANTGAVGSFEISEQQIDTIAGWFHNSFVFQWFSMFVLMFILLFFIKKGMA